MGRRRKTRVEILWENPPGGGLVIRRQLCGQTYERAVPRKGELTVMEAAILFRVSRPTVYKLIQRGELKSRTVNGRVMIPVHSVRARLAGGR